ncbi:MAG: 2-oxo-4-hydroxy-4-carboxy-5-ureidoimidazoline decarboxylase [Actinomycetes bacterium]
MEQPRGTITELSVAWLDGLDDEQAAVELSVCCAADAWLTTMLAERPFRALRSLHGASDAIIRLMDDAALGQALAAHARIGERRDGTTREDNWSRTEQSAALAADEDLTSRLAEGNREYEERFGHVFLIRGSGRTAEEMYDALRSRLTNDAEAERAVVRRELAEIVRLRLTKLVTQGEAQGETQ